MLILLKWNVSQRSEGSDAIKLATKLLQFLQMCKGEVYFLRKILKFAIFVWQFCFPFGKYANFELGKLPMQ